MKKCLHNRVDKQMLKRNLSVKEQKRVTLSFYEYYHIANPLTSRDQLYETFSKLKVFGRIYIAKEGINGQVSVPQENLQKFKECFEDYDFLSSCRLNQAVEDDGKSFYLLKIKVKKKIVADGLMDDEIDLSKRAKHIEPEIFNEMVQNPNAVIVDMRNHYESEVGHFKDAICPDVETFRESLPEIKKILEEHNDKNIIMYCTGGIRCEKAGAYLRSKGFENIYQLKGGIIEYSRTVKEKGLPNLFLGKNFVFDERLGERISNDIIARCHQCGKPSDNHKNCANDRCHLLFIQCEKCANKYHNCCSKKCSEYLNLSEAEKMKLKNKIRFNGTSNGKARFPVKLKDVGLEVFH